MKHTKGPWKVVAAVGANNKSFDIDDCNGHEVVREVQSHDAHLIAAAPDMLEACKFALGRLETAKKYGPDMLSSMRLCIEDAAKLLAASIAKAEGGEE